MPFMRGSHPSYGSSVLGAAARASRTPRWKLASLLRTSSAEREGPPPLLSGAAAPGSPYTIAGPNGLVVVPILCSAPTSPGVHICSPASGSTVHSPVLISAASTVTGTIARMEVWVDGVKKYTSTSGNVLNTSVNLAAGTHRFGVFAINSAGQKWENAISATVQ